MALIFDPARSRKQRVAPVPFYVVHGEYDDLSRRLVVSGTMSIRPKSLILAVDGQALNAKLTKAQNNDGITVWTLCAALPRLDPGASVEVKVVRAQKGVQSHFVQIQTKTMSQQVAACLARYPGKDSLAPLDPLQLFKQAQNKTFSIPVRWLDIDAVTFAQYMERMDYQERYPVFWNAAGTKVRQKILSHFIAFQLCAPQTGGFYLDASNKLSPIADILSREYEVAEALDQGEIKGSNEQIFSGNLHGIISTDSYAQLEGMSDLDFLFEAKRLLRERGRLTIVPLGLSEQTEILTSVGQWQLGGKSGSAFPAFDPRAVVVRDEGQSEPYFKSLSPGDLESDLSSVDEMSWIVYVPRSDDPKLILPAFALLGVKTAKPKLE